MLIRRAIDQSNWHESYQWNETQTLMCCTSYIDNVSVLCVRGNGKIGVRPNLFIGIKYPIAAIVVDIDQLSYQKVAFRWHVSMHILIKLI